MMWIIQHLVWDEMGATSSAIWGIHIAIDGLESGFDFILFLLCQNIVNGLIKCGEQPSSKLYC